MLLGLVIWSRPVTGARSTREEPTPTPRLPQGGCWGGWPSRSRAGRVPGSLEKEEMRSVGASLPSISPLWPQRLATVLSRGHSPAGCHRAWALEPDGLAGVSGP